MQERSILYFIDQLPFFEVMHCPEYHRWQKKFRKLPNFWTNSKGVVTPEQKKYAELQFMGALFGDTATLKNTFFPLNSSNSVLHQFMFDCWTLRCQVNKKSSSSRPRPQLIRVVIMGPLHTPPTANLHETEKTKCKENKCCKSRFQKRKDNFYITLHIVMVDDNTRGNINTSDHKHLGNGLLRLLDHIWFLKLSLNF